MSDSKKYTAKLAGQHILVIGGSSGVGFCVAEAALEFGAKVTISSSNQQRIDSAVARLKSSYPSKTTEAGFIRGFSANLSGNDMELQIADLFAKVGVVDHVVFTAGDRRITGGVLDNTLETLQAAGMVRFFAPFLVAKVILNGGYMKSSVSSSITFSSSVAADQPHPVLGVPSAFAAGTYGMTQSLALNMAPIRVNVVSLGPVETEIWDNYTADQLEEILKTLSKRLLTGRFGRPEDVAEGYLYSMRDTNLTGTVLRSNGGQLLS